jgi:hypothetical protein
VLFGQGSPLGENDGKNGILTLPMCPNADVSPGNSDQSAILLYDEIHRIHDQVAWCELGMSRFTDSLTETKASRGQ